MIISQLQLYDFRKFKSINGQPGLSISFHKGINALIGENDSGKTAVIDAIKLVLLTQSNEYIRASDEDFYTDSNNISVSEFRINLVITDFTQDEAKNFIEYLSFKQDKTGKNQYYLTLYYRAWKEKNRIFSELRAGGIDEGVVIDNKARELLKAVYLKPLRDAEREMRSGRNSRISQILINHSIFSNGEDNELVGLLKEYNEKIERYFTDAQGKAILTTIRNILSEFIDQDSPNEANLITSEMKLKAILENLSLTSPEFHPGLGELNLLFIAAELLLLDHDDNDALKLALIEELEAHLHPQAQLRLINYLQKEYQDSGVQIIISTHSTILASKINLKNIILIKNGSGYGLDPDNTKLQRGDYLFLQRFLDVTKANLFFAKGVIMVEGDAENLVIPVIADIIGYPLEKYGVSLVNLGSIGFLRYSRIFARTDNSTIDIPVSIVTDCDVKPEVTKNGVFDSKIEETTKAISTKIEKYNLGSIKTFVAPRWTFEYSIALSCLSDKIHYAIHYAEKIKNSDEYTLTANKIKKIKIDVENEKATWDTEKLNTDEKAYKIYELMLNKNGKSGLKAITAQCLAANLQLSFAELPKDFAEENDMFDLDLFQWKIVESKKIALKEQIEGDQYLQYIVNAIKHAAGVDIE